MASPSTFTAPILFREQVSFAKAPSLPAGSISKTDIVASADVEASKLEHQYAATVSQKLGTDAATEAAVAHVVYGTSGSLLAFEAGAVTPAGATTTVTVDLKKNGTTVLSGVITLNNTQAAYQLVSGTISGATLAADDVLTVHFTLSGANEPQGVFARLVWTEKAA